MPEIDVSEFKHSTPSYLGSIRDEIDMDPIYQRQGGLWSLEKKQLLIDSIINDFDLPKIYLHEVRTQGERRFALVDGKQRLGAIFDFIDNGFPLADDFKLLRDPSIGLAGKTFNDLREEFPSITARFLSTSLPIHVIRTDEIELVEEMFSRLNEAVALTAPEKRNAFHGPAPKAARELITHPFFVRDLPFSNNRYRHLDLAAKFLMWEDAWRETPQFVRDVKKVYLDEFFRDVHRDKNGEVRIAACVKASRKRLSAMSKVFIQDDPLLASVGMVSTYYILWQDRPFNGDPPPERSELKAFDDARKAPSASGTDDLNRGHLALFEFNRLAQSPNDSGALVYRFRVLDTFLRARAEGVDPLDAIAFLAPAEVTKDE